MHGADTETNLNLKIVTWYQQHDSFSNETFSLRIFEEKMLENLGLEKKGALKPIPKFDLSFGLPIPKPGFACTYTIFETMV